MPSFSSVYDQYDDDGKFLRKELSGKGIPAIIKVAANLSDAKVKHAEDYALVANTEHGVEYRYPVLDAGNAVASAIYFGEYGDSLPAEMRKEAAEKISAALVSFGFTPPEDLTKTAAIELGYSGEGEDMSLETLFGFSGSSDDTMELVEDAFEGLSPRGKRRLALQVKEAGAEFSEKLSNYAADTLGSDFGLAMDTRRLVVLEADAILELEELEKKASAGFVGEPLAEALTAFDEKYKITHHYNKVILDPYASVFGSTVEKNASVDRPVEIDGNEYTSDMIASWANGGGASQLADTFGEDFRDQFQADPPTVLASLPVTHKQAIARMINEGN